MIIPGFGPEGEAEQLGTEGVDNLVTNAERICTFKQQHIELTNQGPIVGLKGQYELLLAEERRLLDVLQLAPPPGDLRRLRRRAIYYWSITVILFIAGFFAILLSFEPFRLGWKAYLYCGGIAVLTPFLVERWLETKSMEKIVKALTAIAAAAALGSLMLLAVIRGDLLARQIHQDSTPAVVVDDSQPQPEAQNTFYDSTVVLLRAALFLMAFAMELGAGLVLREAWRSTSDSSEDWKQLRKELVGVRQRMIEIACQVTFLRNEPGIYRTRFWYDFYRAMLSNAVRSAMTKLPVLILGIVVLAARPAHAQAHVNEVIAIDLTQSVATTSPDAKSDFQKNIDGVAHLLSQAELGSRITVIGITDHSFAQPYILLSAHVPDDAGYFGERLAAARSQLIRVWKQRSGHLTPNFRQTDILGALQLANQIFDQQPDADHRMLIFFSDMRQSTPELDLEAPEIVPPFATVTTQCGAIPKLRNVQSYVLGVDGAGRSSAYWQSLQAFWRDYFQNAGAVLKSYSVLREMPQATQGISRRAPMPNIRPEVLLYIEGF
jgi:hypothetical protein